LVTPIATTVAWLITSWRHPAGEDVRPDKIDGAVAFIMALQHAMLPTEAPPPTGHVNDRLEVLL